MNTTEMPFAKSSEMKLGLKLFVIFFVILLLLVPLGLIGKLAGERKTRADQTGGEIIGMNGGRPSVIGPFMLVPVTVMERGENDKPFAHKYNIAILAETLSVTGGFSTEMRSRGIYKVPLFSGVVRLGADFSRAAEKLETLLYDESYTVDWTKAYYALELTDKRSLKSTPLLSVDGTESTVMRGNESVLGWGGSSVTAKADDGPKPVHIEVTFTLGGGGSLSVYPFGRTVSCDIRSDWKSPSFTGYVMPSGYEITDKGFTASWYIPASSQPYPDAFIVGNTQTNFELASFGVDLFQPVTVYHKTERALKYGFLFIIVPFVVFFLFEIFLKRRIHPLQYALIGFADVLFYLILLSFSEHIPFIAAYACGAIAVCALVAFYSSSILGHWKRGLVMVPVLGGIYLYLYVALESEDFALLVGSIGVFALLAGFMVLTRKIDWYAPLLGGMGGKDDDPERTYGDDPK